MKEIDKWLEQFRKIWEDRFNQFDKVLSTKLKPNKNEKKRQLRQNVRTF